MSFCLACYNLFISPLPQRGLFKTRARALRLSGLTISPGVRVSSGAQFLDRYISIGADTWVGPDVLILSCDLGPVHIGKNVDIAPRVTIVSGSHTLGSSHRRAGVGNGSEVIIGDGTWIGANCTIIAGAQIGKGSVVAAGSVVIAGIYPDNVLLAGVPAVIKRQLPSEL